MKIDELNNQYKIWYLLHFAIFNENKPGKLRFVFDAATKVNGKSLDDFLLGSPGLYNSFVEIIWKFRAQLNKNLNITMFMKQYPKAVNVVIWMIILIVKIL